MLTQLTITAALLAGAPTTSASNCADEAEEFLAAGRYVEAAQQGEQCPSEVAIVVLPKIATARAKLKHGAHAAAHIRGYAALADARPDLIDHLQGLVRDLVVPVEIDISDTLARSTVFRADFVNDDRPPLYINYQALARGVTGRELALDPGTWRLSLLREGDVIAEKTISARSGLVVYLEPVAKPEERAEDLSTDRRTRQDDGPQPPPSPHQRLALGLGVASATAGVAGAGVLIGRSTVDTPDLSNNGSTTQIEDAYGRAMVRADLLWRSTVLVGAGLGGSAVAVTELLEAPRVVLFGELVGGAVMTAGGIAYSVLHTRLYRIESEAAAQRNPFHGGFEDNWLRRHAASEVGSGLLLGAGTGLLVGAATSLIVHAIHKKRGERSPRRSPLTWRRPL